MADLSTFYVSLLLVIVVDLLLLLRALGRDELALHLPLHLLADHIHHRVDALGVRGHLLHLLWHLLLHLLLHHGWLQHVDVLRVRHVVDQVVHLRLTDAALFEEILALEQIEAHLSGLLHELLLLVMEVQGDETHVLAISVRAHGELLLHKTALFLGACVGTYVVLAHPV